MATASSPSAMDSSTIPAEAQFGHGVPASNGQSAPRDQRHSESTWPLPPKPASGETRASSTGKRVRKQESSQSPEARSPPERPARLPKITIQMEAASQPQALGVGGLPYDQANAHASVPEGVTERSGGKTSASRPGVPKPQQVTNAAAAPPSVRTESRSEPVPSFSFPRPSARKASTDPGNVMEAPSTSTASASSNSTAPFSQPGPYPAPLRRGTRDTSAGDLTEDREFPAPLRVGNTAPNPVDDQMAGTLGIYAAETNISQTDIPIVLDTRPPSETTRPRQGSSPPTFQPRTSDVHQFPRKPVRSPPRPSPPMGSSRASPSQTQMGIDPLRSSPPIPPSKLDHPANHSTAYRPSTATSPPQTQGVASGSPPTGTRPPKPTRQTTWTGASSQVTSPPGVTSPPRPAPSPPRGASPPRPAHSPPRIASPPRPAPSYMGRNHSPSNSVDSNMSTDSASSTRPLFQPQRQNTDLSKGSRQNSELDRSKLTVGNGGFHGAGDGKMGAGQSPYMNVLRSYDKIPRVHNILVSFFVWILLAGFVIVPGSFTSLKRRVQDGGTLPPEVGRTGGEIEKFLLTRDNTIAMVIGFVCIGVGAFGSAWLALRWRRDYVGLFNYVWLLNKLYMPLILASSAGLIANFTAIYTQQVGEWSTPAVISAIVEASILGVSLLLYFAYNYWLQQRVRAEKEGTFTGWMEKKSRMNKKKKRGARLNGLLARFGRVRKKSVVSVV